MRKGNRMSYVRLILGGALYCGFLATLSSETFLSFSTLLCTAAACSAVIPVKAIGWRTERLDALGCSPKNVSNSGVCVF